MILCPFTSSTKHPKSKRATEKRQYIKPGYHFWPCLGNPPLLTAFMKLSFSNWFPNLNSLFYLNLIILNIFLHLLNLSEIFGSSNWIQRSFFMIYFIFGLWANIGFCGWTNHRYRIEKIQPFIRSFKQSIFFV